MSESAAPQAAAPSYNVPHERVVSIEHPCIIKNFQSGLKSLGGEQQLKHVLEHDIGESTNSAVKNGVEPTAGVSLRPDDPFAKKISSSVTPTANVLMRVTLPKRTGRKRKRGSDEPFVSTEDQDLLTSGSSITATGLLQRMRDNPGHIRVETVGTITDTHRFTNLPDFQMQGDDLPMMRELRDHVMDLKYEKMKDFGAGSDLKHGDEVALPAPPSFLPQLQSAQRKPRHPTTAAQNSHAATTNTDGEPGDTSLLSASSQRPPQLRDLAVNLETQPIPSGPPPDLQPPAPNSAIDQIVLKLTELLNERPIYTRRVYWSRIQDRADKSIRRALIHVAYYLDSGPWRYSIVKHGVDPRSDPQYRIYQTVGYARGAIAPIKEGREYGHPPQHLRIFDGTQVVDLSETWQLCDFTEPLIQRIVQTENIRSEYDPKWGWYYNGTMAKILVIVREKIIALANPGRKEQLTEEEYDVLATLPDVVRKPEECHLDRAKWPKHMCDLAEAIADEALEPTFLGLRGYDEVMPIRFTALMAGESGTTRNDDGDEGESDDVTGGAEHEAVDDEAQDVDGEPAVSSGLLPKDGTDGDWAEENTAR